LLISFAYSAHGALNLANGVATFRIFSHKRISRFIFLLFGRYDRSAFEMAKKFDLAGGQLQLAIELIYGLSTWALGFSDIPFLLPFYYLGFFWSHSAVGLIVAA